MAITTQDFDNAERDLKTVSATSNSRDPDTLAHIQNYNTRLGDQVDTLVGRLAKLGYLPPVTYTAGIVFTANDNTKTIEREGFIYAPLPSELPFTTSGNWASDSDSFFVVQNSVTAGAQFADVISLKAGTAFGSSTPVNFANYLGQKVSTVVNNTISNTGGADYIITNVNPNNLSTLVNGIWVGANHDLGGGFYAEIVKNSTIDPMTFGLIPYAEGESTAAFVGLWRYLREGTLADYVPKVILSTSILIDNPPSEHSTASFVCNFPINWTSSNECHIHCRNVVADWVFQFGTFNAFNLMTLDHFSVRDDDGTCNNGTRWCDSFTARLDSNHCFSDFFVNGIGHQVLNVQDVRNKGLRAFGCQQSFSFIDGNIMRANGDTEGPIFTSLGPAFNTNSMWEVVGQNSTLRGLVLDGGDNMEFNGVVQDSVGGVLFDVVGGAGSIELGTLYLETASTTHNELYVRSAFTGDILMRNTHGSTIGCEARFESGNYSINNTNGGAWVGLFSIGNGVKFTTNSPPKTGYGAGSIRPVVLEDLRPDSAGEEITAGNTRLPQNDFYVVRQTVSSGSNRVILQTGNNSSFQYSIGATVKIFARNATSGAQCVSEAFVSHGFTPTVTIVDQVSTLATIGADITAQRIPSSPNDQLRIKVEATGVDDVDFFCIVTKHEL